MAEMDLSLLKSLAEEMNKLIETQKNAYTDTKNQLNQLRNKKKLSICETCCFEIKDKNGINEVDNNLLEALIKLKVHLAQLKLERERSIKAQTETMQQLHQNESSLLVSLKNEIDANSALKKQLVSQGKKVHVQMFDLIEKSDANEDIDLDFSNIEEIPLSNTKKPKLLNEIEQISDSNNPNNILSMFEKEETM